MPLKLTAEEFNKSPADAYRLSDKGYRVVINHDRYKDRIFELTCRDRRARLEDDNDRKGGCHETIS